MKLKGFALRTFSIVTFILTKHTLFAFNDPECSATKAQLSLVTRNLLLSVNA